MSGTVTIGIYVMQFPDPSETFIVTKVLGLLDAGFDVIIFANQRSDVWSQYGNLTDREDVRRRIMVAPPTEKVWKILTEGVRQVLLKGIRYPAAFYRFLQHCWRYRAENPLGFLKAVYSRAHFIGHDLDVLHIEFDTQALSTVDMKVYLNCKLLVSSRGSFQKTTVLDLYPDAPERIYKWADGYHFISEYLRNSAYQLGLDRDRLTWVIAPAIDLGLFTSNETRGSQQDDILRVITVASLQWAKAHEFAVDAIGLLAREGVPVEYVVLGDGPYQEAPVFAARQWGLWNTETVTFVGNVPREDVPQFLRQADILLHIPHTEGFCNAVIEAQAMGIPVVCSDAGGLVENVEDGVTGFIVPRRNPKAAADRLLLLYKEPKLRSKMGAAGQARAHRLFDIEQQIERFGEVYRELCGS